MLLMVLIMLFDRASSQSVLSAWLRYMNTVSSCIVQMYHS